MPDNRTTARLSDLVRKPEFQRLERRASKRDHASAAQVIRQAEKGVERVLVRVCDNAALRGFATMTAAAQAGQTHVQVEYVDVADGQETWDFLADRYSTGIVLDNAGKALLAWELLPFEEPDAKNRMREGGKGNPISDDLCGQVVVKLADRVMLGKTAISEAFAVLRSNSAEAKELLIKKRRINGAYKKLKSVDGKLANPNHQAFRHAKRIFSDLIKLANMQFSSVFDQRRSDAQELLAAVKSVEQWLQDGLATSEGNDQERDTLASKAGLSPESTSANGDPIEPPSEEHRCEATNAAPALPTDDDLLEGLDRLDNHEDLDVNTKPVQPSVQPATRPALKIVARRPDELDEHERQGLRLAGFG